MPSLTAHCLVKNEENFVGYAIKSVIEFVDQVIVFDTGSIDRTVAIIADLMKQYPGKIIFEEKGECDKKRHTELRNEMIDLTTTDWFMILDGDEVWTRRGMEEAKSVVANAGLECVIAPFYLCVGDICHCSRRGQYEIRGQKIHATPRFFKNIKGTRWGGQYNQDAIYNLAGERVFETDKVSMLSNKFWHLSHLRRSVAGDADYSSGNRRGQKLRETYFLIGAKIKDAVPEVFLEEPCPDYLRPLGGFGSLKNFLELLVRKSLLK